MKHVNGWKSVAEILEESFKLQLARDSKTCVYCNQPLNGEDTAHAKCQAEDHVLGEWLDERRRENGNL